VYALWLLLCRNAGSVAFYRGNDLLANPVPPPKPEETVTASLALHAQGANEDEWIQLKATRDPWRLTDILGGNLLENFLVNASTSERTGRAWRTRLVTQGDIRRADIEEYAENPAGFPQLEKKLKRIVRDTQKRLQRDAGQLSDEGQLEGLARTVLRQLAQEEPVPLSQLKAEIDLQLAYRYLEPEAVRQAGNKLLGALLRDAAAGPEMARAYNETWLDQTAGTPLKPRLAFDTNPALACDQAVEAVHDLV
jgi:hypothetical protein